MERPILTDKTQRPNEDIIFSHIGKLKDLWISLFEYIHSNHPDLLEEWKYYNDGKSWLLKVARKSKTIFWLSIQNGSFRMTFYFTDKAEPAILKSPISDAMKEQFKNRTNKIRGITLTMKYKRDVEYAKSLLRLKLSIK